MSSPEHVHAEHFASPEHEQRAAQLGMWLFLASELLLFTGLFVGYAVYRRVFPAAFLHASRHLDVALGTVNTVVLITSSLTVALAVHFARVGRSRLVAGMLGSSKGVSPAALDSRRGYRGRSWRWPP